MWLKLKTNLADQMAYINAAHIEAVLYEADTNAWAAKIMLKSGESVISVNTPEQIVSTITNAKDENVLIDLTK